MSGTPNVMIDGLYNHVGGAASGSMVGSYLPSVVTRLNQESPLQMSAVYTIAGDEVTMQVDIFVEQAVSSSNNQIHFFVARDGYHNQSNMAVAMLAPEPFSLTSTGQSTSVQRTFTIDPEWYDENLRLVALVQSQTSKEILQATLASPDYVGDVVIDCEPDGVQAGWTLEDSEGNTYTGQGDWNFKAFLVGNYTLTWQDVPRWTSPANNGQVQTLVEDGALTFSGVFSDGPFAPQVSADMAAPDASTGAALVDYDNDGDLDIHVLNSAGPDMLLANSGDSRATFQNVAAGLLADAGNTSQAAWADINKDGHLDVYLAKQGAANVLLLGDGAGDFTPAASYGADDDGDATGAMWIDYNLNGNLDLYVVNSTSANVLLDGLGELTPGFFFFNAQTGAEAVLGNSRSASWTDANLDGRLDLYVVNSFSANVMLENTAIGFNNKTSTSGLGDNTNGTGAAWGDLDNDGDLDLYLANDGMADHFYICNGSFQYNVLPGEEFSDPGHGRGVVMADLDNDMFLDIYVVRNGEPDLLLMNNGDLTFTRVPVGPDEADGPGNAVTCGDIDGDGAVDLFITRDGASNLLLNNTFSDGNNWFDLRLTGAAEQPDAIGARVVLTAGGISQTRLVTGASGYQSMSCRYLNFGLADQTQVDEITIFWPDGTEQTVGPFSANMHLSVTQGQNPTSGVGDGEALPRVTHLDRAYPNPFNPSTTIEFALAHAGPTRLEVFDLNGRLVRTLVNENLGSGRHTATWQGRDRLGRAVASGAYLYRLTAPDGTVQSGRMVMVK